MPFDVRPNRSSTGVPGNAFIGTLVGADLDGDGIEAHELDRAFDDLSRLARDDTRTHA